MKTVRVTKEYAVYNYCELSEDAKDRVKREYLENGETWLG